jgi:hypothetical protein
MNLWDRNILRFYIVMTIKLSYSMIVVEVSPQQVNLIALHPVEHAVFISQYVCRYDFTVYVFECVHLYIRHLPLNVVIRAGGREPLHISSFDATYICEVVFF